MDTILASIRRILNEDEVSPAEAAPVRREESPGKDDVLVLGPSMMVSPPQAAHTKQPEARVPEARPADSRRPEAAALQPSPVAQIPPAPVREQALAANTDQAPLEGLVAARTRAAAALSFDALHEALLRDQPPPPELPSAPPVTLLRSGGPTIEDLVRDELRGLLSTWLDVHLPGMVEKLVRIEIEKLTRRPGI